MVWIQGGGYVKMAQRAQRWGRPARTTIPFSPVVDGEVLAVTPWRALTDGAGRDIELRVLAPGQDGLPPDLADTPSPCCG